MLVLDLNEQINKVVNKIFNYLNGNLNLKKDLDDYYKATGITKNNQRQMNNYTLNYLFERRIGKDKKSIFDFALKDMKDLTSEEINIIDSLKNSIDGIFEVQKITNGKFELFNLTNEKLYTVRPMAKMTKFRNLSVGHFVIGRLLLIEGDYFLYHIVDHITYSNRIMAFQIAISRLVNDPSLFYFDNKEKFEELKKSSEDLAKKFYDIFDSKYVITSNKAADKLIELINEYVDTNKKPDSEKVQKAITPYKNDKYFDVSELSSGGNVMVSAKKGFSSQDKKYNVALVSDAKTGLQVVPFMDIFFEIFESENYKKITNYEKCIQKFITEKQIPPIVLEIAFEKYGNKFISIVNEILKTDYKTLDEIFEKYKRFYLDNPYTSSTLTLYSSYAFKRLLDVTDVKEEEKNKMQKVGRNDLCPCGSGLKYKKCCGKAVQI